tara:strand:- start:147 stop:344 length:198 start_codon:yes stop_codon:yes gene_type:complete
MKAKSSLFATILFATLLVALRMGLDYFADGNLSAEASTDYLIVGVIAAVPMYFFFKNQLLKTGSN